MKAGEKGGGWWWRSPPCSLTVLGRSVLCRTAAGGRRFPRAWSWFWCAVSCCSPRRLCGGCCHLVTGEAGVCWGAESLHSSCALTVGLECMRQEETTCSVLNTPVFFATLTHGAAANQPRVVGQGNEGSRCLSSSLFLQVPTLVRSAL